MTSTFFFLIHARAVGTSKLGFLAKGNNLPKHCNCNWARTLSNPSATQIIVNEGLRCHFSIKLGYYKVCRSSSRPGFRITMKQRRKMVLGTVWGTFCWSYCENCFQLSTALICEDAAASMRTPGGLSIPCHSVMRTQQQKETWLGRSALHWRAFCCPMAPVL